MSQYTRETITQTPYLEDNVKNFLLEACDAEIRATGNEKFLAISNLANRLGEVGRLIQVARG